MVDVPKDIMEAAWAIVNKTMYSGRRADMLSLKIQEALLSERERCTAQGVTTFPGCVLMADGNEQRLTMAFETEADMKLAIDIIERVLFAAPSLSTSAGGGERG